MGLLDPSLPPVDLHEWAGRPYHERLRVMCRDWVVRGFGAPPAVYAFYLLKLALYVGAWLLFASMSEATGGISEVGSWWAHPEAFKKAVLWSLTFEVLGLGAASGPLTARYFPPVGGALYWTRPGTTRLPPWPRLPLTAGHRRGLVDVALYVAVLALALRGLLAPALEVSLILPVITVLAILGLRDKTIFLAARSEHYWLTLIVFLFPGDLIAGSKLVQIALWWGAATSKLNHHFPPVIAVMVQNSPILRWQRLRHTMVRDFPDDLRPSRLATNLAHGGLVIEYGFPLVLLLSSGGWPTVLGLVAMTLFHLYIMTSVPLGVPIEWNVFFVYSLWALFGVHAEVGALTVSSPLLIAILLVALVAVPALGNLRPDLVSFLPSMRYYAGNWGTSLWLFRSGCEQRLDDCLTKTAPIVQNQLRMFYDEDTTTAVLHKALAFRSMHLHGRALNDLVRRAVDDVEAYEINDGEWIAGVVLGWNFGDGHLHHEQLLGAVQERCGFAEGELVCIFLESQPLHRPDLHWRIVDAAAGSLEEGRVTADELRASQPWPDFDTPSVPSETAE